MSYKYLDREKKVTRNSSQFSVNLEETVLSDKSTKYSSESLELFNINIYYKQCYSTCIILNVTQSAVGYLNGPQLAKL